MRKIVVVLLLLIICCNAYAVDANITIGVQEYIINKIEQGNLYVDITLTQPIGNISLYGNYRNEMDVSRWDPLRFAPRQDFYTVGASYNFDFATIRLEHMCMHPVVSESHWSGLQGGYTRFEITLGD